MKTRWRTATKTASLLYFLFYICSICTRSTSAEVVDTTEWDRYNQETSADFGLRVLANSTSTTQALQVNVSFVAITERSSGGSDAVSYAIDQGFMFDGVMDSPMGVSSQYTLSLPNDATLRIKELFLSTAMNQTLPANSTKRAPTDSLLLLHPSGLLVTIQISDWAFIDQSNSLVLTTKLSLSQPILDTVNSDDNVIGDVGRVYEVAYKTHNAQITGIYPRFVEADGNQVATTTVSTSTSDSTTLIYNITIKASGSARYIVSPYYEIKEIPPPNGDGSEQFSDDDYRAAENAVAAFVPILFACSGCIVVTAIGIVCVIEHISHKKLRQQQAASWGS